MRSRQPCGRPADRQRGAGLISTSVGFLVFMLMMLAAVQLLFTLYAAWMGTAAAQAAAREVAGFDSDADRCGAVSAAEAAFLRSLGDYGTDGHATLHWTCGNPDVVRVRVVARHPSVLPERFAGLNPLAALDRTIEVRTESRR